MPRVCIGKQQLHRGQPKTTVMTLDTVSSDQLLYLVSAVCPPPSSFHFFSTYEITLVHLKEKHFLSILTDKLYTLRVGGYPPSISKNLFPVKTMFTPFEHFFFSFFFPF